MTKKVKISFLILVWSIVAIQMYVNYQDRNKIQKMEHREQVVTAFAVAEDKSEGSMIIGQGYFGDMEISDEIKKEMLANLAQKLEIPKGYTFCQSKNEDITQMTLTSEMETSTTNLQIISQGAFENPKQYIIVEIKTNNDEKDMYELYEKVEQVFREIGLEEQVKVEMKVEKNGKRWKIEKS